LEAAATLAFRSASLETEDPYVLGASAMYRATAFLIALVLVMIVSVVIAVVISAREPKMYVYPRDRDTLSARLQLAPGEALIRMNVDELAALYKRYGEETDCSLAGRALELTGTVQECRGASIVLEVPSQRELKSVRCELSGPASIAPGRVIAVRGSYVGRNADREGQMQSAEIR
jgi:tRNA_anti-like